MLSENNPKYHQVFSSSPSENCDAGADSGWYVLRYRIFSQWLKDQLKNAPLEIFHPYRYQKLQSENRVVMREVPVLSGYVFVHASLDEAKAFAQDINLSIMLNPFWESDLESETTTTTDHNPSHGKAGQSSRYICIPHKAMQPFMKAAEIKSCNLNLFDPNVIDVQKDDYVEFVRGELKGVRGYLKPGKGRNGGLVIVPLFHRTSAVDKTKTRKRKHIVAPLSYALSAHQDEVAVIAFAKGNRHAKDCVFDIKPVVNAAFENYVETGQIDPKTCEKLICYVRRYGQARLNTNIQRAQHLLTLYRINFILQNRHVCLELRRMITDEVLSDFYRRKAAALKRSNEQAARKLDVLLSEFEETDKFLQGAM